MYKRMSSIEQSRCVSDMLYDCIANTESSHLSPVCQEICQKLLQSWPESKVSTRLRNMLLKTKLDNDRIAKHAVIFLALHSEPWAREIFLNDTPKVPPAKFNDFVSIELPKLVNKLLTGSFTSLRAFVEDTRWVYVTL
jgi:hypothetical protein